jgi:hypothetical protein
LLLIIGDRICFSVTWLQRYEVLTGAIAMAGLMALCASRERLSGWRSLVIGLAFALMALIHPVFSGLAGGWLVYLAFRTFLLKQSWKPFFVAAAGYAAGWAGFLLYYLPRPQVYATFRNHAFQNREITREQAPLGLHTFVHSLVTIDKPFMAGTVIYLLGMVGVAYLAYALWKARAQWTEFMLREDLAIFIGLGFIGTLGLAQLSYNVISYWCAPWPFAVAMACYLAARLLRDLPGRGWLGAAALVAMVFVHSLYLPARTWYWHKAGFTNIRARIREFAATLPPGGQLYLPEAMWEMYADHHREIMMNSLPYSAGVPMQKRYAEFISARIKPGDIFVVDKLQSHACLIDTSAPGWKVIGHCDLVYHVGGDHGMDATIYQRQ